MAQIRLMVWNIEVYGPGKYGNRPNNVQLVNLIGTVLSAHNVNVFVVIELMSSVAEQVCFSLAQAANAATGHPWAYGTLQCRTNGNRKSYGVLWRTNDNFAITADGAGNNNVALSTLEFPSNFSRRKGRKAALATFRTTDTNTNFVVSAYHAPPSARAIWGLEALAETPALYTVDNAGVGQNVPARLLAGDYNLDVNVQPEYSWLTDPVPLVPPPMAPGQGAGTVAITNARTHLANMPEAVNRWGDILANWSMVPADYRDAQYDNIFYLSPAALPNPVGGVVDLIADVMNPASAVRAIAQQFTTLNAANGWPAFPYAFSVPTPLNVNLNFAACAWMLMRFGVSDHLPVMLTITI